LSSGRSSRDWAILAISMAPSWCGTIMSMNWRSNSPSVAAVAAAPDWEAAAPGAWGACEAGCPDDWQAARSRAVAASGIRRLHPHGCTIILPEPCVRSEAKLAARALRLNMRAWDHAMRLMPALCSSYEAQSRLSNIAQDDWQFSSAAASRRAEPIN
jgi:hypothetical protein